MRIEEYLKDSFAALPKLEPIDISADVLARLPKYNLGPFTDPLIRNVTLCLSLVLMLAGVWARSFVSSSLCVLAVEMQGKAETYRNEQWEAIEANARLSQNDILRTRENSRLILELPDKSNLLLQPDSILQIKRPFPYVEFNLLKGGLLIFAQKSAARKSFSVFAGHLQIRVLGTRFKVLLTDNALQIEVLSGKVEVRDYLEDKKLAVLNKLEKAVIKRQNQRSALVQALLSAEIERLKEEFGFSQERERPHNALYPRALLWWRELKNDEK